MRPGQPERRTHDYRRYGTLDLFAALDVKAGTVIGACERRHRRVEFRAFLDRVEWSVPPDLDVHLVLDNLKIHMIPGLASVSSRSSPSCPARSGLRYPPIWAGAVLPVSRARRTIFTAADGLTSKRRAASRAEPPASTARTSRRRRSWDRGAVIAASPRTRGRRIRSRDSEQPQTALGICQMSGRLIH
jgi:hypothetical protein